MLPAPMVLPKVHCPVCAVIVVRLLEGALPPTVGIASGCDFVPAGAKVVTPLAAAAAAVEDICELLRV